ncbi:MAG: PolC-type DNA polymerase III [Clostridia bacterium]|nr:PolC-type DNA polymerase III [Clostridia bacterium]
MDSSFDAFEIKRIDVSRENGIINIYMHSKSCGLYADAVDFFMKKTGTADGRESVSVHLSWGEKFTSVVADAELRARLWNNVLSFLSVEKPSACALLSVSGSKHRITPEGIFITVSAPAFSILSTEKMHGLLRGMLFDLFGENVPVFIYTADDAEKERREKPAKYDSGAPVDISFSEESYEKEVNETIKKNRSQKRKRNNGYSGADGYQSTASRGDSYKGKGGSRKKRRLTPDEGEELKKDSKGNDILIGGEIFDEPVRMDTINADIGYIAVRGRVFKLETKQIPSGSYIALVSITDNTYSIIAKFFFDAEDLPFVNARFAPGKWLTVYGDVIYDRYSKELTLSVRSAAAYKKPAREDKAERKRVELHLHTTLSAQDAITRPKELMRRVTEWGHPAVAITDHGVVQAYPDIFKAAKDLKSNVKIIYGIECYLTDQPGKQTREEAKNTPSWHCIILVKDLTGLKNLYKLISRSNLDYFYKRPRMPRFEIEALREGLIIGSACSEGELYNAVLNKADDEELQRIASFYDYLEIQPTGNNRYLIREGKVDSERTLEDINKKILALADRLGKLTVATCDVHFLDPEDAVYRCVMQTAMGYKDADEQPPIYLRTTEEMLDEFRYLGDRAYEVVVENTNRIADMTEVIRPVPDGFFPPAIEGSDDDFRRICYEKARATYGDPVPEHIMTRLDKELDSIIGHHYSVMYMAAQKLVAHSAENGYTVGSRGSVGSSVAAYMAGITEVNALPPHYRCPKCFYQEFFFNQEYEAGCDMPDKDCPNCGTPLIKDGFDIPFETFLGFDGDKVPDIDLNFASEDQARAHKYCEVMFGEDYVFRAGTISGLADRTAKGYVRKYLEETGRMATEVEIERLASGFEGVKKTTGQHPGGIMVLPRDMEIYDFTPIQHPADDADSDKITTHFDYHFLHDNILKLDILGHDGPEIVKMLETFTGIKADSVNISDPRVLSLFTSNEELGLDKDLLPIEIPTGSLGIPEFGTSFAIGLLKSTKPKTVSELVRIAGLSHGTDVWQGNASELIANNTATLSECICCRDDIMLYLIKMGIDKKMAFDIMESVRKGKVAKHTEKSWPIWSEEMKKHNVPEWYLRSCEKIQYMFPRAHAVAYVLLSVRMAWFKLYEPLAYYATRFTLKVNDFDGDNMLYGINKATAAMNALRKAGRKLTDKEDDQLTIYDQVIEMYARHIEFLPVDLYRSKATKFVPESGKLRPPFCALQGVGIAAGEALENTGSSVGEYSSIDDLQQRARINKTVVEVLRRNNVLAGLPETDELSLFDL